MTRIRIDLLRLDFQEPNHLLEEVVQDYMRKLAVDKNFEPIIVRSDGESYFLQDGFHRVEAARRSGLSELDAEITPGDYQDMEADFAKILDQIKRGLRQT